MLGILEILSILLDVNSLSKKFNEFLVAEMGGGIFYNNARTFDR